MRTLLRHRILALPFCGLLALIGGPGGRFPGWEPAASGYGPPSEHRQLFVNADGNPNTGYGPPVGRGGQPGGAEYVWDGTNWRRTEPANTLLEGGWGVPVPCVIEAYKDGERIEWAVANCVAFECCTDCCLPGDLDLDGDVDLDDFLLFQAAFTGP